MDSTPDSVYQRLTLYMGESDSWEGRSLWQALLERLRREGIAGATVLRALAGFGAHSRVRTATLVNLSADLPIVFIVVDRAEKLAEALPWISAMVGEGLITLEPMTVVKYSHREAPHLPEQQSVREVMTRDVVTVPADASIGAVARLLLASHFTAVPVVDESERLVGIISDGDFLAWPELALRFRNPESLDGTTLGDLLAEVDASRATAADIMTRKVVTLREEQPVSEAAHLLIQRELKTLPVVDANGRVVGILSRIDILRRLVHDVPAPAAAADTAPKGLYRLRDVMRRDVPTVAPGAGLTEIVEKMLTADLSRVIVVDEDRRPLGVITDGDLVARVQPQAREGVVRSLWRRIGLAAEPLPVGQCAEDLMSCPLLTAPEDTPIQEAIRLMVQEKRRRLAVVDASGRLVGIADRRSLLRALLGGAIHG